MTKILNLIFLCVLSFSYAQEIKFGKVSKEELSEKSYAKDPDADAAYLLKKEYLRYEYNGDKGWYTVKEVHERIKIYTKEGFDYASKTIELHQDNEVLEKVKTLKAFSYSLENNKIKKVNLAKKDIFTQQYHKAFFAKKFTMPNIQKGSVIEWKYTVHSPFYTYVDDMYLQEEIPIKKLDIRFDIPEFFTFKTITKESISKQIKMNTKKRSLYFYFSEPIKSSYGMIGTGSQKYDGSMNFLENKFSLKQDFIPSIKQENYILNLNRYKTTLKLELAYTLFPNEEKKFYTTAWRSVSKKVNESKYFGEELKKENYYIPGLNPILENKTSPLERMYAVLDFAKSNFTWNKTYGIKTDQGVVKAFKKQSGNVADINLSLVSMLNFAGLNAKPVLVNSQGKNIPFYPTLRGFNYVLAHVELNGKSYLLDATDPYSYPNIIPTRALNFQGRLLEDNFKSSWVYLIGKSIKSHHIKAKINSDYKIEGSLRSSFKKQAALTFRSSKNHLSEEKLITELENKYSIDIQNYKLYNKEKLSKSVIRNITFSSDNLIEGINGNLHINPLLFMTLSANPFKSEDRTLPVDFEIAWTNNHKVSLEIPEGYVLKSLPESFAVKISDDLGSFRFKTKLSENKIIINATLSINHNFIPLKNYSELKMLFDKAVKKQGEKIILSPKKI